MIDVDVVDPDVRTSSDPSKTWVSVPVSAACMVLLAVGLAGWAGGLAPARWTGLVLYTLVGFGAAILFVLRLPGWSVLTMSAPVGLTTTLLIGFVLVEGRVWSVGTPLFEGVLAASGCVHVWVLTTAGVRFRRRRGRWMPRLRIRQMAEGLATKGASWPFTWVDTAVIGFSVVGILCCTTSAAALGNIQSSRPAVFFGAVSAAWYVGAVFVVAAVVVGLWKSTVPVAAAAVIALDLVVTLTITLAYTEPYLPWAAKHVGVTLYIMRHGSVDTSIDIYQAWPGLFAGVGWVCRSVGNLDPLVVARWWPPVIDLATVIIFQPLAKRALGDVRRSWIAVAVLIVGNTIGQDYFSPQATGFFLAIALFAMVYRTAYQPRGLGAREWVPVGAMAIVIAVTHQLTPYMVTGVMVVLVLFGRARSRLLPAVAFVPAAVWALRNLSVVRQYLDVGQLGRVFENLLPKGLAMPKGLEVHKSFLIHLDSYAMAADALVIGVVAVVVLLQRRTKTHVAWGLCALSGAGLFLVNSYGNEGAFRVVLFALPWLAILFADWRGVGGRPWLLLPLASIPLLFGMFVSAKLGLTDIQVVRPGDVQAIRVFERTAPAGSKLFILGYNFAPIKSTARYAVLQYHYYPYIQTPGNDGPHFEPSVSYKRFVVAHIPDQSQALRKHRIYVLAAQEPEAAMVQYGLATSREYGLMTEEFTRSRDWTVVSRTRTASLFELRTAFTNVSAPVISGVAQDGKRLMASPGSWPSLKRLSFSYQWEVCNPASPGTSLPVSCAPVAGATNRTYGLDAEDVGHQVTVIVTARDPYGDTSTATAAMTIVVANPPPPVNLAEPVVAGTAEDGQDLAVSGDRWQSPDKLRINVQWELCGSPGGECAPMAGAEFRELRLRPEDVGHYVEAVVTAVDAEGQSTQATIALIGPVVGPPPPSPMQTPLVNGVATIGSTLGVTPVRWLSPDYLMFSYQWEQCDATATGCAPIAGATESTYRLRDADVGHDVTVTVTATDQEGGTGSAMAPPVGPVQG